MAAKPAFFDEKIKSGIASASAGLMSPHASEVEKSEPPETLGLFVGERGVCVPERSLPRCGCGAGTQG